MSFLSGEADRLHAIDHGLCFHAEDKLRTVIWDFAGEAIAPELVEALRSLQEAEGRVAAGAGGVPAARGNGCPRGRDWKSY